MPTPSTTAHLISTGPGERWAVAPGPDRAFYRHGNRLYADSGDAFAGCHALCYRLPFEGEAVGTWVREAGPGTAVEVTPVPHEESGLVLGEYLEVGDVVVIGPNLAARVEDVSSLLDESASVTVEALNFPLVVGAYQPVPTMRERVVDWGPYHFSEEEALSLVGRRYMMNSALPHRPGGVGCISEVAGPRGDGSCSVVLTWDPSPPFRREHLSRWSLFAVYSDGPQKGERVFEPLDGLDGGPWG